MTARMPLIGENVKLYTYLYVREDAMILYGFFTRDDLEVFKLLIGVSGIGPKGALNILSVITPSDLRLAVALEDSKLIATAPGIGLKTAKKLIIELKDKLKEPETDLEAGRGETSGAAAGLIGSDVGELQKEAIEALIALGYDRSESASAVRKASEGLKEEEMDVEVLLRGALRHLF
ncbi:MAG: Holliday junction branch migration protein RuvA [Lachnospiraceae bacterium]|nr:Holliday junction branch migration protein RuvA [Lachnospiraceae bacterium]